MSERTAALLALHRLLAPDEAAEILGVSPGTLTVWRSTGRVNLTYVKIGSRVKYRPEDIEAFIKHHTRTHTSASAALA